MPGAPEGIVHGLGDSGADGAQVSEGQAEDEADHGAVQVLAAGSGADDEAAAQEGSQGDAQEEAEVQEMQLPRVCQWQQEEVADGAAVGHCCVWPWAPVHGERTVTSQDRLLGAKAVPFPAHCPAGAPPPLFLLWENLHPVPCLSSTWAV